MEALSYCVPIPYGQQQRWRRLVLLLFASSLFSSPFNRNLCHGTPRPRPRRSTSPFELPSSFTPLAQRNHHPLTPSFWASPKLHPSILIRGGYSSHEKAGIASDNNDVPLMTKTATTNSSTSKSSSPSRVEQKPSEDSSNNDDERYSRQVYTLGKRAHSLIRSSTIYLDGPPSSGLLYEVAKNLVLSGIHRIVIVHNDDTSSKVSGIRNYHDSTLDDLGAAYQRAASLETKIRVDEGPVDDDQDHSNKKDDSDSTVILLEYLKRLNPSVQVAWCDSRTWWHDCRRDGPSSPVVYMTVDRPLSYNLKVNAEIRNVDGENDKGESDGGFGGADNDGATTRSFGRLVKFVAVETAGLYGQLFTDFGPNFVVYDSTGETAAVTPLLQVQLLPDPSMVDETTAAAVDDHPEAGVTQSYFNGRAQIYCLPGEKHDLSQGDEVQFHGRNGKVLRLSPTPSAEDGEDDNDGRLTCFVERVISPYLIQVQFRQPTAEKSDKSRHEPLLEQQQLQLQQLMANDAVAFSRIEPTQSLSFFPLAQALDRVLRHRSSVKCAASSSYANFDDDLVVPSDLDKYSDPSQGRSKLLLQCFASLDALVQRHGRLPCNSIHRRKDDDTRDDVSVFMSILRHQQQQDLKGNEENDSAASVPKDNKNDNPTHKRLSQLFVQTCAAKFTPLQAVMGAVAAQEALKAASGLYTPIRQFFFFDCEEVAPNHKNGGSDQRGKCSDEGGEDWEKEVPGGDDALPATFGLRHILGSSIVENLQRRQKILVVGAGAIGCELLKNLAAMGLATGDGGKIILTDMDTIEKSNLSRQLLFRDRDLGRFKSTAARSSALLFNPLCNIEAHSSKVGPAGDEDQSSPFGQESFWHKQVDIVMNALDNVEARLYIDGQCVKYHKPLVDAGTMGPKGNVQVVVPKFSESYSSSADPPDEAIPVCTLKNFPYAIAHTIQWARDLFDGLFVQRARQANDFVTTLQQELMKVGVGDSDALIGGGTDKQRQIIFRLAQKLEHEVGKEMAIVSAQELSEDLMTVCDGRTDADHNHTGPLHVRTIREKALKWAVALARKLYVETVDDLLRSHPLDSKDDDGDAFWSGTRRPPSKLIYAERPHLGVFNEHQELVNENLVAFVRHGARLRTETFLSPSTADVLFTEEEAKCALQAVLDGQLFDDDGMKHMPRASSDAEENQSGIFHSLSKIPVDKIGMQKEHSLLKVADFEKDQDSNGHVAFITAASNLRAISYGIPPVDAMETRRVAGKIIPAMITTTALVSALSCIELVKLVQPRTTKKASPLSRYRNAFVNLARNFFAFVPPLPAETRPGLNGKEYTLWDQLSISESAKEAANNNNRGMTVSTLLRRIRKLVDPNDATVRVSSVSWGPYLLYANFLHEEDRSLLKSSIWDVIQEALLFDSTETDGKLGEDAIQSSQSSSQNGSTDDLSRKDLVYDLSVVVEDVESGEEVELPTIRLRRFRRD